MDDALFQQIYQAYGVSIYRFCLLQMKNAADAEDVMQEVFFKRLYRAPDFASAEHERRWLFRVARNQCRDACRRRHRTDVPLDEALLVPLPPEEQSLLELVAALPEAQRTVIHLHYYEGYALDEIASLLGIGLSAVKMRLKRGREALRDRLEGTI